MLFAVCFLLFWCSHLKGYLFQECVLEKLNFPLIGWIIGSNQQDSLIVFKNDSLFESQ